jgi:hypothetical protein
MLTIKHFEMEHDTHCELGQYIKSLSNIYWMIDETKYLL